MQYGKRVRYKTALLTLFYPELYQQKLPTSARPCSGKHYPTMTGEFSFPSYLMIKMMELKKDLVLKTPLPTASSGHHRSPRRSSSVVKHEIKIRKYAQAAFKKLPRSPSCTSAERFIQMEGKKATGHFRSLNTDQIVSPLPVLNLTCCIIIRSDIYVGVFFFQNFPKSFTFLHPSQPLKPRAIVSFQH